MLRLLTPTLKKSRKTATGKATVVVEAVLAVEPWEQHVVERPNERFLVGCPVKSAGTERHPRALLVLLCQYGCLDPLRRRSPIGNCS